MTKNVIKKKSDVDKWKKNPKYYDVRSIDTQPKELVEERIKVVHKHAGNIPIVPEGGIYRIRGRDTRDALAVYSRHPLNYKDLGKIIIRPKKIVKKSNSYYNYNTIITHELGHAYDRNALKGVNIGYDIWKGVPKSIEKKDYGFGKTNNLMVELGRKSYKEVWKPVEEVTRTKLYPYSPEGKKVFDKRGNLIGVQRVKKGYHEYRQKKEELFANWFSGFITQKNVVKRKSGHFYNVFKKQNKPLFRDLRMSDLSVTQKYIGGKNAKSWKFF
ncbi:hypothetical protein HYU14_01925 [Candidatus Woesearchaeota archaeon]|nr:hypothetical protein [Candidatus Woesearchaeota archaeon]